MIAKPRAASAVSANGAPAPALLIFGLYTRKSTEKGLNSIFNSLDAQREILEDFVASHRQEGWIASPDRYDDGGYSGKNEKRPAFQRLLADLDAGKIGGIATYKLDRLSRDSADSSRFFKMCRERGITVVSPTERADMDTAVDRFNLTLRMGVAQLEREQASERVRDKIAASRKRGMWTGGAVPLGYRSENKRLVIDTAGAETVHAIVAIYLETGSLTGTLEALRDRGIVAKSGVPFTAATLRNLLHNPLLGGRIRAGDQVVTAAHEPILDEPTWEALQAKLAQPETPVRRHRRVKTSALLANLLRCGKCGSSVSPHYTAKANGRRHPAYVCQSIVRKGAKACPGSRVPGHALEAFVIEKVRAIGRDPQVLREAVVAAAGELTTLQAEAGAKAKSTKADVERLRGEQTALVEAVANGGAKAPALVERLAALPAELEAAEQAAARAKADLAALKHTTIKEEELRQAVASFDAVWKHLIPAERQRILGLLVQRITVTAGDGCTKVDVTYSPEGARALLAKSRRTEP